MNELGMKQLIRKFVQEELRKSVPIGISNRHLHVSEKDFTKLFPGRELRVKKWLKQPGEFAAEEVVTLVGPKGEIANVRILGPVRAKTQIELSLTDARTLGIKAPICLSGQLDEAARITLRSEFGEVSVKAAIVAQRHIHMNPEEAVLLGVAGKESISVKVSSPNRTTIFEDVAVRIGKGYVLELHLDTDEANSAGAEADTLGEILLGN